jgi:hypothetical protein
VRRDGCIFSARDFFLCMNWSERGGEGDEFAAAADMIADGGVERDPLARVIAVFEGVAVADRRAAPPRLLLRRQLRWWRRW